jgi:hypothetical protein
VLSTIDHLSVLMAYIYTGVMIGSYLYGRYDRKLFIVVVFLCK